MDIRETITSLSPEEKREFAKRLLRERTRAGAGGAAGADAIPKSHYLLDHHPVAMSILRAAEAFAFEDPYFRVHDGLARDTTTIDGREYINFSNYNYLGLSGHPAVRSAITAAVERYGTSVSASRMVGGERPLHRDLERALADLHGVEDAVVMVSGYGTNVTAIAHLFGPK